MKTTRKVLALILAMVMVMGLATVASAATIVNNYADHNYKAYQIFSGQTDDNGVLGNIEWGNGVSSDAFLAALQSLTVNGDTPFADCATAEDVAKVLSTVSDNSELAKKFARTAHDYVTGNGVDITAQVQSVEMDDGYYLIVDVTDPVGAGDAYNASLLQVTGKGPITIAKKTDAPSVDKKVGEDDKTATGALSGDYSNNYNDVADYNIGEDVPFMYTSLVPDMTYYDTYYFAFKDHMSAGLTLKPETIVVKIGNMTLVKGTDYTVSEVTAVSDGDYTQEFSIVISDLKAVCEKYAIGAGATITVEYKATLNSGAFIGLPGNPNKVKIEYSNNPEDTGKGETPWDTVIVFTYGLDTTKVDGTNDDAPLEGAGFVLYKKVGATDYYATVDATSHKLTGWVTDIKQATTLTSGADGKFIVIGLDDGEYWLKETITPPGYNTIEDVKVTITATTANNQSWNGVPNTALTNLGVMYNETTGTGSTQSCIVAGDIQNNKGTQLPETGGMGTTMFYVVGTILLFGAAILLVTKRRMTAE